MAKITKSGSAGVALIRSFEGFYARPYNDPVGYATVGYGYLLHYSNVTNNDRHGTWLAGQKTRGVLTKEEASKLLARELDEKYEPPVEALNLPLNQNQFDALVSFVYNVGPGGIGPNTGVGRALRRKDWRAAANHILDWDKAGGEALAGLTRRRKAERALFLKPGPTDPAEFLTRSEKDNVKVLLDQRAIATRNGGWSKVDLSHNAKAEKAKTWLRARANLLASQDQSKNHRKERIAYLRDVALNRL